MAAAGGPERWNDLGGPGGQADVRYFYIIIFFNSINCHVRPCQTRAIQTATTNCLTRQRRNLFILRFITAVFIRLRLPVFRVLRLTAYLLQIIH